MSTAIFSDKRTEHFDPSCKEDDSGLGIKKPWYSVSSCSHPTEASFEIYGLENDLLDREIMLPSGWLTRTVSNAGSPKPVAAWRASRPKAQSRSPVDNLQYETDDETVLVSDSSLSSVSDRLPPIVNLSKTQFLEIETSHSTSVDSPSSRVSYHDILQKWMEDRKRWENCHLEYEKKLNIAKSNLKRQKEHWQKESAKGFTGREKLKLANKTIRELKLKLKIVSDRAGFLEEQFNLINRTNSKYTRQKNESCESLKKSLSSAFGSCCSHKKELRERGRSEACITFRELDKRVGNRGVVGTGKAVASKSVYEKPLLKSSNQRLSWKEKEAKTVSQLRKSYQHSRIKLQEAKLEIVDLRESNSILTKRLEELEKNIENKIISSQKGNIFLGTGVESLEVRKHSATQTSPLNPIPCEASSMTISDPVSLCFLSKSAPAVLTGSPFCKSDISMLKYIKDLLQIKSLDSSILPSHSRVKRTSKRQKLSMSLRIKRKQICTKKKNQRSKPNSGCYSMSRLITQPVLANRRK